MVSYEKTSTEAYYEDFLGRFRLGDDSDLMAEFEDK
jgi:hypothetical protein|tara:strand:- start:4471 stop:4578 length:108 start_codon:yes stop_codon:yes gene_type:complete